MKLFREHIRQRFGNAFASKASDAICRKLCKKGSLAFRRYYLKHNVISHGVIVETIDNFSVKPSIEASDGTQVNNKIEDFRSLRVEFAKKWKSSVLNTIKGVSDELIQKSEIPPKGHSASICWSNASILTFANFDTLAEIAHDPLVTLIDLPEPVKREIYVTGKTTGIRQYRRLGGLTGSGIIVALVDGEVFADHPFLAERVRQMADVSGEGWGRPDWHATAVAGIVGSANAQYSGMAPGCIIYNYKAFHTKGKRTSNDHLVNLGIDKAMDDGAEIINLSWGGKRVRSKKSRSARSCDTAWDVGIPVIKSAGNKGTRPKRLTIPAEADGIIVVGATDKKCEFIPDYSSGGQFTGQYYKPDMVAPGGTEEDGIITCSITGEFHEAGFGTSFSVPHVSGLIALMLERENMTPDKIKQVLMQDYCEFMLDAPAWAQGAGVIKCFTPD